MAQTPEQMTQSMIDNLPEKTGKDLAGWIAHLKEQGLAKHGEIMKHLKDDHSMGHGYANLVSQMARKSDQPAETEDDLVTLQYAKKPNLKPIYDAVIARIEGFGDDVELAPKKAYVSLRRSKQFGLLQPSTKTRFDVGLKLTDVETTDRLETAGSWNSMVSHRVRVTSEDEVDDELIGWLQTAYEQA
ncbi:MAG: DUF4287 domain-containing protein [Acidobacteriota bacterium]